jgi:hypothetical protein
MIVPLARKSVIAGIFCSKPPRFDSIDPGRLCFARRANYTEHRNDGTPFPKSKVSKMFVAMEKLKAELVALTERERADLTLFLLNS